MQAVFAVLLIALFANVQTANAQPVDHVRPCLTEVVKTPTGVKSYEVQLLSDDKRGYHTMRIFRNEGSKRTELPSIAIYFQADGQISRMISVETREAIMAYRERAATTREGAVRIFDGPVEQQLNMTCYL